LVLLCWELVDSSSTDATLTEESSTTACSHRVNETKMILKLDFLLYTYSAKAPALEANDLKIESSVLSNTAGESNSANFP